MKKVIHVNQHIIKSNCKKGTKLPTITVKTYKENIYGDEVRILGASKVVYTPDKPLSCGAVCYIETDEIVDIFVDGKLVTRLE